MAVPRMLRKRGPQLNPKKISRPFVDAATGARFEEGQSAWTSVPPRILYTLILFFATAESFTVTYKYV